MQNICGDDPDVSAAGIGLQHASAIESESVLADSDPKLSRLNSIIKPLPKSHFKSLAGIVKETLVTMCKVQVVDLKSVIVSQREWRSTSEGYQNLFEFGALPFIACCVSCCFSSLPIFADTFPSRFHDAVSCGFVTRDEHSRLFHRQHCS
jgi:hypothetical protein